MNCPTVGSVPSTTPRSTASGPDRRRARTASTLRSRSQPRRRSLRAHAGRARADDRSRPAGSGRCARPARPRRTTPRARAARWHHALGRPTARPTPRRDRRRRSIVRTSESTFDVDRARSAQLERDERRAGLARRHAIDFVINAAFGGSSRPFTCTMTMPRRPPSLCAPIPGAGRSPIQTPTPRAPTPPRPWRGLGHGGIASASRSMRGWRLRASAPPPTSSSSRARAASGRRP